MTTGQPTDQLSNREIWESSFGSSRLRDADFETMSGIPLEPVYGPDDGEFPGQYPYTRGPYSSMYRSKLWTMRMFAGFGTADDTNWRFKETYHIVNLQQIDARFADGDTVDHAALRAKKLVKGDDRPVKVLGNGAIGKKVILEVDAVSASAREKIVAAGGTVRTPAGDVSVEKEDKVKADGE